MSPQWTEYLPVQTFFQTFACLLFTAWAMDTVTAFLAAWEVEDWTFLVEVAVNGLDFEEETFTMRGSW